MRRSEAVTIPTASSDIFVAGTPRSGGGPTARKTPCPARASMSRARLRILRVTLGSIKP